MVIQSEYWNGSAGKKWASLADNQDTLLGKLGEAAMDAGSLSNAQSVLDIGCGSGGSTFEISRRIGSGGAVWGVDISKPMLDIAITRLTNHDIGNVKFSEADVTTLDFTNHSFDRAFSRFGVMFFEDPVASFVNIANSLKPNGKLAFCCWRSLSKNEWFELPLNVGLKYCAPPNQVDPHAPGPMAFKDQDRINSILNASGFTKVSIHDHESKLVVGPTPKIAASNLTDVGPLSRLVQNSDNHIKILVQTELEKQLMEHVTSRGVELNSNIWIVTANKG
jgi:ubiquinone/menaquinone biosynthesis C-methylase UbiE